MLPERWACNCSVPKASDNSSVLIRARDRAGGRLRGHSSVGGMTSYLDLGQGLEIEGLLRLLHGCR